MKKFFYLCTLLLSIYLGTTACQAAGDNDFIFRAMSDELERSMSRLTLKDHPKPYFVSYNVREFKADALSASFGAITLQTQSHSRTLDCDVRIGDYKLDSSSGLGHFSLSGLGLTGEGTLPIDDSYDALRRELWLKTDSAYKSAVERLKYNENYLKQHNVEDKPDSLSKEKPVVHIESLPQYTFDTKRWTDSVRQLSAVFKDYPNIRDSKADVVAAAENRWLMNNEGFKYRCGDTGYMVNISAQTTASDGMRIADDDMFLAWTEKELPDQIQLEKAARQLADRLAQLAAAPVAANYRGPVLFEGQAGAEFFYQLLSPKVVSSSSSLVRLGGSGGMAEKLGERILPKFITVVDDPKAKEWNGQRLFGTYDVDDDGVEGQKITLIENGILKTLCMSRVPNRAIKQSNGHSKNGTAVTSNVFIQSENKLSADALKARLIELGKEDGLKEVYIVRKLQESPVELGAVVQTLMRAIAGGGGSSSLYPPVLLYKVSTEDGKEDLCRGGTFTNVSMRVLRDVDATGDDVKAYPVIWHGTGVTSVVAPSVVVKEIEIQRPERTNTKGPVLKNPYFDK